MISSSHQAVFLSRFLATRGHPAHTPRVRRTDSQFCYYLIADRYNLCGHKTTIRKDIRKGSTVADSIRKIERFGKKKHEIAQVEAQIQAQVKVLIANLSPQEFRKKKIGTQVRLENKSRYPTSLNLSLRRNRNSSG